MDAEDLQLGDDIRKADGSTGEVESIAIEKTSQEMYNLTVDEAHTFFVGDGQWLVHNSNCRLYDPLNDKAALMDFANRAKAYSEGRGLSPLYDDWQAIVNDGLDEGEELYMFTRNGQVNGVIDIYLDGTIPGTNQPGLYFNLLEVAGNNPQALPELANILYRRSIEAGYEGWTYGNALPQVERFYRLLGAQYVEVAEGRQIVKYAIIDPSKWERALRMLRFGGGP